MMPVTSKPKQGDPGDSDRSSDDGGNQVIEINNIKLDNGKDFPIDLDVAAEFQNILAAGILHSPDHIQVYDQICEIIFNSDRTFKLTTTLFWTVFCIKYQPKSQDTLQELRTKLSKLYAKHFAKLPSPKEKFINYLIFLCAYCIQITFYSVFPKNRDKLTMRFILDIYHIVIYELNGLYVSDSYIQSSIEKIIGTRFFFYEQKQSKKKQKSETKDKNGGPLLRDLNFNPDSLLEVPGGVEFASELSGRLRDKKFWITSHDTSHLPGLGHPKLGNNAKKSLRKPLSKNHEEAVKPNDTEASENTANLYFPQIRFDCTQISPTVSRFLNNPTMSLPSQEKKLMKYTNNKHIMQVKHYNIPSSLDHLITKKSTNQEKSQAKLTRFQRYELKNRPDNYALDYLPADDKFNLKERFKQEIDLKYILDHVGNYSLKPTSYRNFEENKKTSYSYFKSYHSPQEEPAKGISFAGHAKPNETQTHETEFSLERFEPEPHESKVDSIKDSPAAHLLTETDKNSKTNFRKQPNLTLEMSSHHGKETEDQTTTTPLLTPHNPALSKKLGRASKRIQMINALKHDHEPAHQTHREKVHITAPLQKINLSIQDFSGKAKKEEILVADDKHAEKRKNERGFVYEDKRQHYIDSHSSLFSKDIDRNINDLVGTLLLKQNKFSRNIKYARKARK